MTGDNHSQDARTFRPDPDEYDHAKIALEARNRGINAYLRACLRWLRVDADAALTTLAPYWPDPRPAGRPRRVVDE